MYLAELMRSMGHDVTMLTSSFSHTAKKPKVKSNQDYVHYFKEPGYPTNVCPQRLISHEVAGWNLNRMLGQIGRPDLVYCSVPSISVSSCSSRWASKWGVPFVIDVQDLWPEQFRMAFNVPVISDVIFAPMKGWVNNVYSRADYVFAVSETYVQRALSVNSHAHGKSVFLGTALGDFDSCASSCKYSDSDGRIRIAYIGTLGTSYDLPTIIKAMSLLRAQVDTQLIVMGDGPHRAKFQSLAKSLGIDALFPGTLPYNEMVTHLTACDIAVNPFIATAPHSIVNKVGDYAAAGLPVVNTLGTPEYRHLLEEYDAGINCPPENAESVSDALKRLALNGDLRKKMGAGNRRLAEERFDKSRTYLGLIEQLCRLV